MGSDLVARDHVIDRLVSAVRGGTGAVVSGDAGVGKTALVSAAAERLTEGGAHVAWVVATGASRSMAFGALAPLLPDDLASLHPALVMGAVARRLRELAADRPVVVVVDDAHHLDDQSAATVLGLVTSGAARLLVTMRTGEPVADAITVLWKDHLVDSLDVGPLDQRETALFLSSRLGNEVAPAAAEVLWAQTRGNPLYLTEIVRAGRLDRRLVDVGGVWLWRGDMGLPPRLADLVERRFDGLSEPGLDAVAALVLGSPLTYEVITTVVTPEALDELERRGLVDLQLRDGRTLVTLAHPVLAATAARMVSPTRRRRIARALVASDAPVDAVRRATWRLDVDGPVDAEALVAASQAVVLTQPELAARLAERALADDPGPGAALALAAARAELGDVDGARRAEGVAATRIRDVDDRFALHLDELALTTFSERRPDAALARVAELRRELPDRFALDLDSIAALVTMFAARPGPALLRAEQVLAADPPQSASLRAQVARIAGLALGDRADEAVTASESLLATVATTKVSPYAQGLAHAIAGLARLTIWNEERAIVMDPAAGRWPVPPAVDASRRVEAVAWPLLEGARRLFEGNLGQASARLREAVVQQQAGEGLFRSEAVALLAVSLAASGAPDEAEAVLQSSPPDSLAVFPGLGEWAAFAVDAARGLPSAVEHAFAAAEEARAAGAVVSVVAYLAEAARLGAAKRAAEVLDGLGRDVVAPLTAARAVGIRARATGDGMALLEAAERHVAIGLARPAAELADLAVAALGRGPARARQRAQALVGEMRRRSRDGTAAAEPVVPLTRRELEVARLAVSGMSDRDIAATLVVSVRTVESHLAACYRKLAITSRRALREILVGGR